MKVGDLVETAEFGVGFIIEMTFNHYLFLPLTKSGAPSQWLEWDESNVEVISQSA